MPIEPGSRIGAYEVRDFVGRGAMGVVYRAWHEGLARPAAVKVLQALAPDDQATARFRREAQSIAQMRHPNILQVFDFGEVDGVPYMIVEYIPGGSLADRLKRGWMAAADVIATLRGVAAALDYAHGLGVVHRDVKPANVLLAADGTPILADFGLAKLLQSASVRTQTGVTTGTPAYMAPEQVTGDAVGPAADRYALAAVAYEMLTGSPPFVSEGLLELLYAHVHREVEPPSARRPGIPPAVDAVLLNGLAKTPEQRWPSCTQMVEKLAAALLGTPAESTARLAPAPAAGATPTPEPGPPPPARPRSRRSRGAALAAAGVLGLLLLGAAGYQLTRPQPTLAVSATDPVAGTRVTLTAHHLPAGQRGTVQIESVRRELAGFQADGGGDVAVEVRIPDGFEGAHTLWLCWNQACRVSVAIDVLRPAPTPTPTPRPTPTATPSPVFHPTILIQPLTPRAGASIRVTGHGFDPARQFTIAFRQGASGPVPLQAPGAVAKDGSWVAQVNVPGSAQPGTALVIACMFAGPTPPAGDCTQQEIQIQK